MPKLREKPNLRNIRKYEFICNENDTEYYQVEPNKLFTICSYNVLSEKQRLQNIRSYDSRTQHINTSWEGRWPRIVETLLCRRADVYCLQEVEKTHYTDQFLPLFKAGNYECFFTSRGENCPDGCMLAYSKHKFTHHWFEDVPFNYNVMGFNRDNAGQLIFLQEINANHRMIIVANTQICEDSREHNVKIGQNILLLAHLDRIYLSASQFKEFSGVFLCGNMGFKPFSPLYNFICNGNLDFTKFDIKDVAKVITERNNNNRFWPSKYKIQPEVRIYYKACSFLEASVASKFMEVEMICHPRRFLSAYEYLKSEVTSYKSFREGGSCDDYIFYTGLWSRDKQKVIERRIHLRRILKLPTMNQLTNLCGPLPNIQSGSDHLPLFAEFILF